MDSSPEASSPSSSSENSCRIFDGHLDPQTNISRLNEKDKWNLKVRYLTLVNPHARLITAAGLQLPFDLRFLQHPQRPCVKQVNAWKKDGQVSVATTACSYCVKINSARPSGSGDAPFSCLVRSRPNKDDLRLDGSQVCASCSGLDRASCRAWGGTHPKGSTGRRQSIEASQGRDTLDRSSSEVDCLDDGSDLSSASEVEASPCSAVTDTDSDAPLAIRRAKRKRAGRKNASDEEGGRKYGTRRYLRRDSSTTLVPNESSQSKAFRSREKSSSPFEC